MDKATLIEYKNSWQYFEQDYKNRLIKLKDLPRYECFYDVIDFMLENNVRLEQESIIYIHKTQTETISLGFAEMSK